MSVESGLQELTRNSTATIGTDSSLISHAKNRKMWYVKNTSTGGQTITVALKGQAVAGSGFVLEVGSHIIESTSENYPVYDGEISAVSSGAGGTIAIVERVL